MSQRIFQTSTFLIPPMSPVIIEPGYGPTHWKCPDCFEPCSCSVAIRDFMPHVRCGRSRTEEPT